MKKLLFIVVALVAALSVNAQNENKELVPLLKVNFEGVTPKYMLDSSEEPQLSRPFDL